MKFNQPDFRPCSLVRNRVTDEYGYVMVVYADTPYIKVLCSSRKVRESTPWGLWHVDDVEQPSAPI